MPHTSSFFRRVFFGKEPKQEVIKTKGAESNWWGGNCDPRIFPKGRGLCTGYYQMSLMNDSIHTWKERQRFPSITTKTMKSTPKLIAVVSLLTVGLLSPSWAGGPRSKITYKPLEPGKKVSSVSVESQNNVKFAYASKRLKR